MSKFKEDLRKYRNAGFTGIWINCIDPTETGEKIREMFKEEVRVVSWDEESGFSDNVEIMTPVPGLAPAKYFTDAAPAQETILLAHNLHRHTSKAPVKQALANAIHTINPCTIIVLAQTKKIDNELEKLFVLMDAPLPTEEEMASLAARLKKNGESFLLTKEAAREALGLSEFEAENVFALSVAKHGEINSEEIRKLKCQAIEKSGILEIEKQEESFKDIVGLQGIKKFCKQSLLHSREGLRAKGVMVLGVGGTGKSMFAKALGKETGLQTIRLKSENIKTSLYGESEQLISRALMTAQAIAPCIMFIDEIEGLLAGANRAGDPGATMGIMKTLMQFMQDDTTGVYFIATSNDISELPGPFLRSGRWDAVFFVGMPDDEQRIELWKKKKNKYGISHTDPKPLSKWWTGAEIESCCKIAALMKIELREAAKYVIPLWESRTREVKDIIEAAKGTAISANTGEAFK